MERWISAREPAMQVCPVAAKIPETTPLTASSRFGVVENDVGGFAAQFERDVFDAARGQFVDVLAGAVAAGEGDLGDVGMRDQRLADFVAEAGDDVDDAGRETGFLKQLAERERGDGRIFGWLPHDCVARGQSGRELPGGQQERRVPWRDGGDHAQRLFAREIEDAGFIDGDDAAFDLVGESAEIVEPLRDVVELRRAFRRSACRCRWIRSGPDASASAAISSPSLWSSAPRAVAVSLRQSP